MHSAKISTLALLAILVLPGAAWAQQDGASAPAPDTPEAVEQAEQAEQTNSPEKADASAPSNPYVAGKLQTVERDRFFAKRAPSAAERFQSADADLALVDRRRAISPMADRNILAPMAQTPAEGTVSYSNLNIFANFLTYGASDDLALTAGMVIPTSDGDFIMSLSAKYKLYESRNIIVSVLPFWAMDQGTQTLDTYQMGLGTGVFADFHVADSLVLGAGVAGFATLYAGYEKYGSDCTRSAFRAEDCPVEDVTMTVPAGGHWLAGTLGANWLLSESFSVSAEYILGGVWGTFLGVEDLPNGNDLAARRDRFENPDFASGFPHGQGPTFSLAGAWTNGTSGLQLAVVLIRQQDDPDTVVVDESGRYQPLPVLSGVVNF